MPRSVTPDRAGSTGRLLLALGVALPLLGIAGYVVQSSLRDLSAPWYVPVLATLGLVLVIVSLYVRRTKWRVIGLVFVAFLTLGEWATLFMMRLPPYSGPVAIGQPFPSFTTLTSDGARFTERDFAGEQNTVLVFFRGRW